LTTETLFLPRTPANPGDLYQIKISASESKTGWPVVLSIPAELTGHLTWYLGHVLPGGYRGPIFLQRGGDPRQDFSAVARAITQQLIGRPMSAHTFRASITSIFYGRGDVSDEQLRHLAATMNHSVDVQRSH
jgi:hypothetical protein